VSAGFQTIEIGYDSIPMRPLDDLFVVDLSRILSGPICSMMMADMGAQVVKVEPPPFGDDSRQWGPPFVGGISTYFHSINRGKKSLGLNLKTDEGKRILWQLIDRADVILENFRPGVIAGLGFGYEAVAARNPRLIYCSISGFGQTGPYKDRPGYDVIAQGESGIMDLTGYPDQPPAKVGTSISDIVTGMYAFQGVLLALVARARSNRGQFIDISLLDSTVSTLTYQSLMYLATGKAPGRMGTRHPSIVPYECFEVLDGYVNIGVTNQKQWIAFCRVLGMPEMADDSRFKTMKDRLAHYDLLKQVITPRLRAMTRAEAIEKLSEPGIPVGPVNSLAEVLSDPQIQAREMIKELTHPDYGPIPQLGIPLKLSDTPGIVAVAPPRFGEHNQDILKMLGFSDQEIGEYRKNGVIAEAPASY
jgi:crotonobetainyl-CoA:carnitine CoA-transferase CaiB-like acyl-CoA transferase